MKASATVRGSGRNSGNARLDAIIRLHTSDIEHTVSGASTVSSLVTAMAAYLTVIALVVTEVLSIKEFGAAARAFLPLPLIVIICYHATTLAGIMRRAGSAAILEKQLMSWAGLSEQERSQVGTKRSDEILDINAVWKGPDPSLHRLVHSLYLLYPYFGWYILSAAATWFVLNKSWHSLGSDPSTPTMDWALLTIAIVLSALGWVVITVFAARVFLAPPKEPESYNGVALDPASDAAKLLTPGGPSANERVAALARLHESDIHGNIASNTMSMAFYLTTVVYIALIATNSSSAKTLPAWMFMLLAFPLVLLQGYLLLLLAGVMGRSDSARLIEDKLFELGVAAGFANRNAIGAQQSDVITDLRRIDEYARETRTWFWMRWVRKTIAAAPHVGLGLIGFFATGAVIWKASDRYPDETSFQWCNMPVLIPVGLYLVFWLMFFYMFVQLYQEKSAWRRRRGY